MSPDVTSYSFVYFNLDNKEITQKTKKWKQWNKGATCFDDLRKLDTYIDTEQKEFVV